MTALKNKIVTVFGGSGFVGRHLVAALIKEGAVVRVASRLKNSCYHLRTGALVGQVVPLQVDYSDPKSLRAAMKGADFAVNLIGIMHGGKARFEDVHVALAGQLARIAKKEKLEHFVQVSALGADVDAESHYQRTKAEGEIAVLKAFPGATVYRPSVVFGEGDGFFSRFAKMTRLLPVLPLIGGGKTRFQPVYVGDLVDAIVLAMAYHNDIPENFEGQVIECAGPQAYSFKELLEYIQEQINARALLVNVPWWLARFMAMFWQRLPGKILTVDQVKSLRMDNVETGAHLTLEDIGIVPTPVEVIVPDYLVAFRTGGQFARRTV